MLKQTELSTLKSPICKNWTLHAGIFWHDGLFLNMQI